MIFDLLQPGHFIPRFTTTRWGLCIPDGCSAEDAKQIISHSLRPYNYSINTGLKFTVHVSEDECSVLDKDSGIFDIDILTIAVSGIFVTLIVSVIIATIKDKFLPTKEDAGSSEKLLLCFSLKRSVGILLKEETSSNEITCIHGVRSICTVMLYFAHKLIPMGNTPFTNRSDLTDVSIHFLS